MTSIGRMLLHQTIDVCYNVVHIECGDMFMFHAFRLWIYVYANRNCGRDETFLHHQVELQDQISPFFVSEDFVIAVQLC